MKYKINFREVNSNDIIEVNADNMFWDGQIDMSCDSFEATCTGKATEEDLICNKVYEAMD